MKKTKSLVGITLLATLIPLVLGGALFVPRALASSLAGAVAVNVGTTVITSPPFDTSLSWAGGPGSSFYVYIDVINVTALYSFTCGFNFSQKYLQVTNITLGSFLSAGGTVDEMVPPTINNTGGYVIAGDWSLTGYTTPGVNGSGHLLQVGFEVTSAISSLPAGTKVNMVELSTAFGSAYLDLIDINDADVTPAATNVYSGTLAVAKTYLVVRGLDDRIYYRAYNSSSVSWGNWNVIPGGATVDSPAAAVYSGTLYIVVCGENNRSLWFGSVNLTSNNFSGWTALNWQTPSAPTLVTYGTALCLVARGVDDHIYCRFYNIASQTWTSWEMVPSGATLDSPAAATLGNQLYIIVRGMDGSSIWQGYLVNSTSQFSGWTLVSGATPSAPALASYQASSELDLMVRGEDNGIYHGFWNASGWQGWTRLTGGTLNAPGVTVVGSTLQVAVQGMDGSSIWFATINLTTKAFSGWTLLSGATPSAPTLTS